MKFPEELKKYHDIVEQGLQSLMTRCYNQNSPVHGACRYALEGQGKRIRPILTLLANKACGGQVEQALQPALALEMVHTYSLVHDDLPCMDDDDYRRGRLTTHKKFDDATALLAGDALLTDAFSEATKDEGLDSKYRLAISQCLAQVSGSSGMVLGQDQDMFWTGQDKYHLDNLNFIHSHKTGKLIAGACKIGALSAEASPEKSTLFYNFGLNLGIAFQIMDDLLDDTEDTGKSRGKDIEQGKLTYLALMSNSEAKDLAEAYTAKAFDSLAEFGSEAEPLRTLAKALLERTR